MLAILLAVGASPSAMGQQGWSPQPFVPDSQMRPLSNAPATPANHLRGDSGPDETKPVVLRWRSQSQAQQMSTVSNHAVFEEATIARTSQQPVSASSSSRSAVAAASPVTPAANWTDRETPRATRIVRAVVEPEAAGVQWNARNQSPTSVVPAQFDEPPTAKPGNPDAGDLFDSNLLPPRKPLPLEEMLPPKEPVPGTENAPAKDSLRSLLEPKEPEVPSKPANPFPPKSTRDEPDLLGSEESSDKSKDNERIPSPSDMDLPPPNLRNSKGGDSAPTRPKSTKRNDVKCDDVRDRAFSADIDKIKLDIAPSFGVSVSQNDKRTPEEKRENFAKTAPNRSWYDHSGAPIGEGRLIDFAHSEIIIESQGGGRTSIPLRKLSEPDAAYVSEVWGLPQTCSLGSDRIAARVYEPTTVAWKASGLCHKPLYFEEIQLERSGHEYGPIIQPAISSVHFFKNIAFLPYKMGINPMTECQYSLGHYRPGNCAPWSIEPIPLSLRGAAAQAKVITGAVLVLP